MAVIMLDIERNRLNAPWPVVRPYFFLHIRFASASDELDEYCPPTTDFKPREVT
jgi:hypothetical protein